MNKEMKKKWTTYFKRADLPAFNFVIKKRIVCLHDELYLFSFFSSLRLPSFLFFSFKVVSSLFLDPFLRGSFNSAPATFASIRSLYHGRHPWPDCRGPTRWRTSRTWWVCEQASKSIIFFFFSFPRRNWLSAHCMLQVYCKLMPVYASLCKLMQVNSWMIVKPCLLGLQEKMSFGQFDHVFFVIVWPCGWTHC